MDKAKSELRLYEKNAPPPEFLTPLPLPGEFIVLQLNPVAMTKHWRKLGLTKAYQSLQLRKYMAIMLEYCEQLSPSKPWHLAHVLIVYDEDPELSSAEDLDDDNPFSAAHRRRAVQKKKRRLMQPLLVRIRTRLCDLPRTNSIEFPPKLFRDLRNFGREYWKRSDILPVNTRELLMDRGPDSPLVRWVEVRKTKLDPEEWETGTKLQRLCLIPHFDYSFDLNDTISFGSHLLQEQGLVIAMLRSVDPQMPLKTRIPISYQHIDTDDYLMEPRNFEDLSRKYNDMRDLLWQRSEHARKFKEWKAYEEQGWFARFFFDTNAHPPHPVEVPKPLEILRSPEVVSIDLHRLVFAPQGLDKVVIDPKLQELLRMEEPSLLDLLLDLWNEIREVVVAWWSPESIYHDVEEDEPYIPFAETGWEPPVPVAEEGENEDMGNSESSQCEPT